MWHLVIVNGMSDDLTESGGWCDLRMKRLAEWTFEGGPKFWTKSRHRREPNPLPIRSVCLYMRKWTICQFEWHRDNKILLPSQRTTGNVVFLKTVFWYPFYHSFFLADKMQKIGLVIFWSLFENHFRKVWHILCGKPFLTCSRQF